MVSFRFLLTCFALLSLFAAPQTALAQSRVTSPRQRIAEVEERLLERIDALEQKLAEVQETTDDKQNDRGLFADGLETIGGVELRFGGKAELLLIDTQSDTHPTLGRTDEPDPYLLLQRLRLSPSLRFNRHIEARGQIDLRPDEGRLTLKEFTVRHRATPFWWLRSTVAVGLDDRFIRPDRQTKTYPLVGNAFWRDETLGATWSLRIGRADGRPEPDEDAEDEAQESDLDRPSGFDWADLGQLTVHASVGQGTSLAGNEVGFDGATFNGIVQDDRSLDEDLAVSEIGVGLEYERDLGVAGELSVLGFFYRDRLDDTSLSFLQQDLTVRDAGGAAIAGYGDSNSRRSYRYGAGIRYFLPARTLFGSLLELKKRDGLNLLAQWIHGEDGRLERDGWFVQGSFKYTFPVRLIADRYFRSFEPLVRYGELDTDLSTVSSLPGTWDRQELVLGAILEVTSEIYIKTEYAFHREDAGTLGSVDNNELLVELLLEF